jgi:GNAT superfamily N-acetyltransferase
VKDSVGVPPEKCAWIVFLQTMKNVRGKGYGKRLITDFMNTAKKYPVLVRTSTDYDYGFYEYMGFARVHDFEMKRRKEHRFLYAYNADREIMKKYRKREKAIRSKLRSQIGNIKIDDDEFVITV